LGGPCYFHLQGENPEGHDLSIKGSPSNEPVGDVSGKDLVCTLKQPDYVSIEGVTLSEMIL